MTRVCKIDDMGVFNECWKNFEKSHSFNDYDKQMISYLNELNQAVFNQLEKRLLDRIKIITLKTPSFIYYVDSWDGYGIESRISNIREYDFIVEQKNTFEQRIEKTIKSIFDIIDNENARTVFFYTPITFQYKNDYEHLKIRMRLINDIAIEVQ